jgi:hypothetical protein
MKQHEQQFEQKVKTERDRPDKKAHAKKFVNHVEDNVSQLGREIEGVGHEAGAAGKDEGQKAKRDVKAKTQGRRTGAGTGSGSGTSTGGSDTAGGNGSARAR